MIGATAAARGGGPAQVLIAWHLQIGISTIPESVNPAQLRENLAAAELTLTPADLAQIAGLDHTSAWLMGRSGCWRAAPGNCRSSGTKADQRSPGAIRSR